MRFWILICQAALLFMSMPAPAAELFYMDHDPVTGEYVGPVGPLVMSGEIKPGDYDRLLSKIMDDQNRYLSQNKIILASDGGDVAEAIKIAALVKSLFAAVVVGPQTGRCVSACFFIYAAAAQRETDGNRLLGINRPYLVETEAAPAGPRTDGEIPDGRALRPVRAFLEDNAVPGYLIDEMFRRASDDAYWLSAEDEKKMGFRSPAFDRYLTLNCAWSDAIQQEVLARKRPLQDLTQLLKCRARVTEDAARQALASASRGSANRAKSAQSAAHKDASTALTDGPAVSVPPTSASE